MQQLITVTDLGPGDGGKGGVVHAFAHHFKAHTILKTGGGQGSHGVRTSDGRSANFKYLGCGTFDGAATVISERFVLEPIAFGNEMRELHDAGLIEQDIRRRFYIHERVLVVSVYHVIISQLNELVLRSNERGTVGTGCGTAYRMAQLDASCAIHIEDLSRDTLRSKLVQQRDQAIDYLSPERFAPTQDVYLLEDLPLARTLWDQLHDSRMIEYQLSHMKGILEWFTLCDDEFITKYVLSQPGAIVVESSHGILTDNHFGFTPHTTALRTTPDLTLTMIHRLGYSGELFNFGIFRGYGIRHGGGPFPTHMPELTNQLLPDSHKDTNRFQGATRAGALDLVLLRYAIEIAGGSEFFNGGLCVTWMDQVRSFGQWHVCNSYQQNDTYMDTAHRLRISTHSGDKHEHYQRGLTEFLKTVQPDITALSVSNLSQESLAHLVARTLYDTLGVPVRMVGFGANERQKILL